MFLNMSERSSENNLCYKLILNGGDNNKNIKKTHTQTCSRERRDQNRSRKEKEEICQSQLLSVGREEIRRKAENREERDLPVPNACSRGRKD